MRSIPSLRPVLAALGAVAVLSMMDAVVKDVVGRHSVGEVVFLRYVFGTLTAAAILVLARGARPTSGTFRRAAMRAVFILSTAGLFFTTLTLLPLAEAVAITFTAPFFLLVVSRLLLGEPMPRRALTAIAIGFVGVLVMLAGRMGAEGHGPLLGYVTGLACSVTYALSTITMRRDTGHDPVMALVLAQNAAAAVGAAPIGLLAFTPPDGTALAFFALAGALGTIGHLLFAYAYANAPASRLAPLEYTAFVWAAAFGAVFFGETPSITTLGGAALIVAACLMVIGRRSA